MVILFSSIFACSSKTLAQWQANGLPIFQEGKPGTPAQYDLCAVMDWARAWFENQGIAKTRAEYGVGDLDEARERFLQMQAARKLKELELRRAEGKTIAREHALLALKTVVGLFRGKLAALPALLIQELNQPGLESIVEELVTEIADELAGAARSGAIGLGGNAADVSDRAEDTAVGMGG